jgi:diacylglycerol kinase (ATP)
MLVIANPVAGQKVGITTNAATPDDIARALADRGLEHEMVVTESEEHLVSVAGDAAKRGEPLVVAAGGDGTVGQVARQLLGTDSVLGILPIGSVMNIARMLDIPRDLAGAVEVLATGAARTIDAGEARTGTAREVFFETGAVGLKAALFQQLNEERGVRAGSFADALRTLWTYTAPRLTIRLDQRTIRTRALSVVICNGPYSGLAFTVAPDARIDDGRLDIVVFSGFTRLEFVWHLAATAFGRRRYSPKIRTYRSHRASFESRRPAPAWADAIDLGTTPATFSIIPGALRVMAPIPEPA